MAAHFQAVTAINHAPNGSRLGEDIYFERVRNPPPDDASVEKLRSDYEETVSALKDMDLSEDDFDTLFNQLLAGAQVGLQGVDFNLDAGRSQLRNVRERLVGLARRRRDRYLIELALIGGGVAVVSLILAGLLNSGLPGRIAGQELASTFSGLLKWLTPVCLLHPGVVLGVVFTALVLNRTLTYEKIRTFDPYYFSPGLRFFYISVISYILFAALWFKVVMLGLGGILLNDVTDNPSIAVLIGLVCGVSEVVVVDLLVSRFKPVERGNTAP
jgi:hypothetical protein